MEVGIVSSNQYGCAKKGGSVGCFFLRGLTLRNNLGRSVVTQSTMLSMQPMADNKPR
jgi:hypothetical protein